MTLIMIVIPSPSDGVIPDVVNRGWVGQAAHTLSEQDHDNRAPRYGHIGTHGDPTDTMTITEELHINCPPSTAFDLMADVRKLTEWNKGVSRAEMTTADPVGQGSTFVTVNRGQEMESTITTCDRPRRLDFMVTGKTMTVAARFDFDSADSGTKLVIEFDPAPKGVFKLLFPVLKPIIRRDLAKQHQKFKTFCEAKHQPDHP